jgi:pimeloyl-ACP methyl ester carboxylesterase
MYITRPKIWLYARIFIIVYCSVGIAIYTFQDDIVFHPQKLESNHHFNFKVPFQEVTVPFNKEDTLSMVKLFPVDSIRRGIVIYFHGNKRNLERFVPFAKVFTDNGYEVWIPDYPGYGKSTGVITEDKLYDQAVQVQQMAAVKYPAEKIIIYGKSLGSGIGAYVASVTKNKRLILETPYYSIPDIFNAYSYIYPMSKMINYKLPTYEYLKETIEPVTVFAGGADWIIPYRCAVKLKPYLKNTDQFIKIDNAGHNDLNRSPEYFEAMNRILR